MAYPIPDPWERARADRNSYQRVRTRLDVAHLIDFMLLWTYGDCESEFRSCGPLEPGTGFKFWIADADGFLDRPLPPPGQGVRAVLMGDSFGQGLQVRDRERFSEVAELLMPGLHVLNAAAAGRSAFHHALLAPRLQAVFVITVSNVILRSGFLPRWLAFVGFATGFVMMVIPFISQPLGLAFPAWVFLVSVVILVTGPGRGPVVDAQPEGGTVESTVVR
mgnify:CR=1 FL=1